MKQYYAEITRRDGTIDNGTYRALNYYHSPYFLEGVRGENSRYTYSYEKAVKHAKWCVKEAAPESQNAPVRVQSGMVGMSSQPSYDKGFEVISYKIKAREVTDWREVDCEQVHE